MKPSTSFLIPISALCKSSLGLSIHSANSLLSHPHIRVVPEDVVTQRNTGIGAEAVSPTLWRRALRLDSSSIVSIFVGAIGGVAMVIALFVGILLVIRNRRDRQKARGLAQSSTKAHFPTGPKPPQPAPRVNNMESAWFLDNAGKNARSRKAMSPLGVSSKTSRQRVDVEGKPVDTSPTPAPATTLPLVPGPEPDSTAVVSTSKSLPPLPDDDPERLLSPTTFRQPEAPMIIVSPRPRGSSLAHASRPTLAIPLPAWRRHLSSVSEDIRPVSRFSISPVSPSFPSGSHGTSRARHTRLPGVGSLSSLGLLRSATTPDVPTDVSE
ncbi:hypothetical protein C8R44DRAFT_148458 [Mycena epipterygia]|nr:hypothetical protein C8R44DRAFT_148458 [Mycena epipterygia]